MPRVETSLLLGGNSQNNQNQYNNVSKIIGHDSRFKREVNEENPKPKRRVVKKLKRVQPIHHTTRRPRRKLVIKKKKKRLLGTNASDEVLPQATKPRRKVVITRKRLLIKPSTTSITEDVVKTTQKSKDHILTNSVSSEETTDSSVEDISEENQIEDANNKHVPDYEPFFPELSDTLDAPVLLLKTTVLSSIEFLTKTVVQSRLRTYTFIVTRVNGDEKIVTSTTEIRPQTKTSILTEPLTKFTTLTLLDFDATSTLNPIPMTPFPASPQLKNIEEGQGRAFEEARYNLATRVMSNGVEVIVAGDKSTLPGEPDVKRVLPSTIYKPITLKPSTLSDHMMMMLPQDASNINSLASLYPNEFVTKTCLTTFTYLTTYLESGTTTVSSHEQVVSNIATEERNTGKILPTPAMGITLTQYPNLSVGVFHTTYTYLNTILDGEQPLVITSKHTVTNTVTAPDDYLMLLQPSENVTALKDTNTYYSTISLEKTIYEGQKSQVVSTNEVVTQVVITESIPPKATSVMTSYIALDVEDPSPKINYTTTDVVKTYFVTYTYHHTLVENGNTVVKKNVSTSSDIVTEKLYVQPKYTKVVKDDKKKHKIDLSGENFKIVATKTYHTTFTYFTTLLQEGNTARPTVISSHSKVVENLVTETIDPKLFDKSYLNSIKKEIREGKETLTKQASLLDGQKLEITVIANKISPTKVLPIERTKMPEKDEINKIEIESSTPNVITGSTIIFLDDEPSVSNETPSLTTSEIKSSSKVVKKTKTVTSTSKLRRTTKTKAKTQTSSTNPTKVIEKKPSTKVVKPATNQVPDLLGLGSINMNSFQALTPVLNAMAGLIQTNLKSNRRNDSIVAQTTPKPKFKANGKEEDAQFPDIQNRSPIYIPVGGIADELEIAESQNIATFHIQETVDWDGHKDLKPTHESPLLNGGIPISPGDVITANSDVIVGKPGRIGPRIPAIPLNQVKDDGYGMKPPPIPQNKWPKRNNDHKHIPVAVEKPIIHAPSKDDYVGPPPPLRGDKPKHIPLNRPVDFNYAQTQDQVFEQVYAQSQNNYGVSYGINEVNHEIKIPNIQDEIQKNYEIAAAKDSFPVYAEGQSLTNNPIIDYNLQPSIVLPEIIERSTGQPLLVNIQPSQVAFVNIPHNRTTALVYGGSTEPHRNGQYFDDPSPYPEPEFSGIEFSNGVPQIASVYHDSPPNQKHVGGVIKVAPQPIKISSIADQQFNINPSRPNQEISLNVPPISFGMVQKDNDFNAHIINHGDTQVIDLRPPGDDIIDLKPPSNRKPSHGNQLNYHQNSDLVHTDISRPTPNINNGNEIYSHQRPHFNRPKGESIVGQHNRKHKIPPRIYSRPNRPKPSFENLEVMTPPPITSNRFSNRPQYTRPQKPVPIPLIPEEYNNQPVSNDSVHSGSNDDDDSDLVNEDGEVIQESNSRPLRPGQVPIEILKAKSTTTEAPIKTKNNSFIRFPNDEERPVVSNPRPFANIPFVRPENQQTNQINNFDHDPVYQITPKPDGGFITYIGTITNRPIEVYHSSSKRPRPTTYRPTIIRNSEKTHRPIPVYIPTTTSKDVIKNRPKVTSLPIDPPTSAPEIKFESQTEKPFKTSKPLTITDLLNREKVSTTTVSSLNIGEIPSDMEILKPPPLVPNRNILPPKIEVNSPGGNIHRVPNLDQKQTPSDLEPHPFVPKPSQEIVPPQPPDDVLGLSPPPLVSTHKPIISTVTTVRVPFIEIVTSTETTRPRRPFTRRPTTTTTTTTKRPIMYRNNRTTTEKILTNDLITPTPTINPTSPSLEVIIGNPNIVGSETVPKESSTETTETLKTTRSRIDATSTKKPPASISSSSRNSSTSSVIATPIHHAGNEIKIIDEATTTTTRKSVLPTRFITHTKTSTVTITKTTVVKTLGGPPSTLTLLVTKTEKSTIVDTVTEFHTLVKPTSIVETITTTVNTGSSLYPPEVYGSAYPSIKIRPSATNVAPIAPTVSLENSDLDDLDEFIINETDPPIVHQKESEENEENDSIFVVMTDKKKGSVIKVPNNSHETQDRDEMLNNNEVNNVLLGGIFISHPPSLEIPRVQNDKCEPECKASRNELCQKVEGIMRCVCRPGFARMFPDRPCIPTYTYSLHVDLERHGREDLDFRPELTNPNSTEFAKLSAVTHEALDRMVMQSDLRDIYHGVHIHGYEPRKTGITTKFYLQLSDNTDEKRLEDVFKKYLRNNNYSLGGTEVYAARESLDDLQVQDFDECTNQKFHDCSENAQCFNLKGTYTCSCKEGFADLSENILYPGRICSAELVGCERCNYHGTCYTRGEDQVLCECFQWYTGESCYINLKVLLIALVTLGAILFILLLVCIILTCCRKKPRQNRSTTTMNFLPQRVSNRGTIDRRAMIQDTSSEDSRSETNTLPYVANKKKLKGALKKTSQQHNGDIENGSNTLISFPDQKDRSLTVMIPRAKYHPAPPTSPLINYTTFDARKPSVPAVTNEAKLLSYLDAGPSPNKSSDNKRKYSASHTDSYVEDKPSSRKTSGALVSAGFEVSATVLPNNMGTLGTTCGTEADRSENATLIQKISADLLSSTGTRSQFNTLRENDIDPMSNWLDITPRINTVSEARSYDETTIPPPMKSFRGDYDSKPSSQHQNDEANTMAERDLGSTFLLPHTHLYKPDRGSDISGFESL